jgi:rubrerythrin
MNTVEIQGISRGAFLVRGALAAGAAYGASAVTPWVARAVAQEGGGDVEILNFALTLEYLEADFYDKASKLSLSEGLKGLARDFGDDEAEHVDALKATISQLGGKPVAMPTFSFPMKDEKDFVKLAVTLEDTGVSAYNGAAPMIQSKEVLAAAGSIVQVEARHAAALRFRSGRDATEGAFDVPLEMAGVLKAVKPFVQA